ncbi:type II toxin-antitoxin system VapC family toxin [Microbacterium sp. B35-30]|uniref:type II toxin-antitoxin system VapC family toxin n=1 Tax=Microbacterium sp. B35-30 TaxID=1962642 RepID=UPI0013D07935|nr:type II toxin-antitoxin system VapC family toxin [Microbacterium sp. B35-30]KAF2419801.1 hypothetical protein B2K11_03495 [Microbacterium sp. B35-30]
MIVDTSAVVAVLKREHGHERLLRLLLTYPARMSAPVLVETRIVVTSSVGPIGLRRLHALLAQADVEIVAFDEAHADIAADAYRDYGRGSRHPARLNLADAYSYALASAADEPLLFVGDDFSRTDVRSALEEYGE